MHLVQDNWRRERKDSGPLRTDTEQEEQKKRPVKQAAVRVSSKKGYSSSVSSKASHTASPLKISSATFYSNVQSKREHTCKGVGFYMFNASKNFHVWRIILHVSVYTQLQTYLCQKIFNLKR